MAKRYSDEFKAEAVRLVVETNCSISGASRDLGISVFTLREWIRKHQIEQGLCRPRSPETLEEENRRLRRELEIVRQERDLLKKAAAYFAKEQL